MIHTYRFGPPVRYWCMRMEAKNGYTKKAASCGNFKNICLSFALHHQNLLAFNLTNSDFMQIDVNSGPGTLEMVVISLIHVSFICFSSS